MKKFRNVNWIPKVTFLCRNVYVTQNWFYFILFLYFLLFVNQIISVLMLIQIVFFYFFRVHACLYFITPNGHGLKSIDLVCMKKLDTKVNIIPIIAKADTINKTELTKFKTKIMSELVSKIKHFIFTIFKMMAISGNFCFIMMIFFSGKQWSSNLSISYSRRICSRSK